MRLDKFLKVSRIIKRRTLAKEVCDGGRCKVSGRTAKAGTELKVGDILEIAFGSRKLAVKVIDLRENVRANEADSLYEVISDTRPAAQPAAEEEEDDW